MYIKKSFESLKVGIPSEKLEVLYVCEAKNTGVKGYTIMSIEEIENYFGKDSIKEIPEKGFVELIPQCPTESQNFRTYCSFDLSAAL